MKQVMVMRYNSAVALKAFIYIYYMHWFSATVFYIRIWVGIPEAEKNIK